VRQEGAAGLYRALPVHLLTWVPFHACYFAVYEKCKAWCINVGYEDGFDNLEPTAQFCCCSAASIVASVLTNPMDVVRARVQVAPSGPEVFPPAGARQVLLNLLRHEGVSALLDGAFTRAAWLAPRTLLCGAVAGELSRRWG